MFKGFALVAKWAVKMHALENKSKVVVAMSGGVDSSVSAGWLKQKGHEVIGISLQLHDMAEDVENKFGTCCSLSDISDARRVAEKLNIPFYVTNMEERFQKAVIDNFVDEYVNGRTPNPCVKCNEKVKFSTLMDWALDLGADYLATGHYANIRYNEETQEHELLKGMDPEKDQSYFLFTLKQQDLARSIFPVGTFRKDEVRDLARKLELSVAEKPDSQEICFVQARNYKEFVEKKAAISSIKNGPIVDLTGKVLGEHSGIHQFTIGQRKGIGIASREPLFAVAIRADKNEVVVGPEEALYQKHCTVSHLNWINRRHSQKLQAKIRYRSKESPVELLPVSDGTAEVYFESPQRAVTPGQAIVFYEGEKVVGGGWIDRANRV